MMILWNTANSRPLDIECDNPIPDANFSDPYQNRLLFSLINGGGDTMPEGVSKKLMKKLLKAAQPYRFDAAAVKSIMFATSLETNTWYLRYLNVRSYYTVPTS